jgi:hypothetical protein
MKSKRQIEPSGAAPSEPITEFEVSDDGTLTLSGFPDAGTRAEFYEDVSSRWARSPADLADSMEECKPLAWEVQSMYSDFRDALQAEIASAEDQERPNRKKIVALNARLASMPEEPKDGAKGWLLGIDGIYFETNIIKRIGKWFSEPPKRGWEDDYLPECATAQGAAVVYFRGLDADSVDLLGVEVIEGEHPGSTYYAAELRGGIEEANAAAESAGLPVRFVAQKD